MTGAEVPRWRSNFAKSGSKVNWLGDAPRPQARAPYVIPGACDIAFLERDGSDFFPLRCAKDFGCQAFPASPRWPDSAIPCDRFPRWKRELFEVVLGTAKTPEECDTFANMVDTAKFHSPS